MIRIMMDGELIKVFKLEQFLKFMVFPRYFPTSEKTLAQSQSGPGGHPLPSAMQVIYSHIRHIIVDSIIATDFAVPPGT